MKEAALLHLERPAVTLKKLESQFSAKEMKVNQSSISRPRLNTGLYGRESQKDHY